MSSTEVARRLSPITESRTPQQIPRTRYLSPPMHTSTLPSSQPHPSGVTADSSSPSSSRTHFGTSSRPPRTTSRTNPTGDSRGTGRYPKIIPARPAPPPPSVSPLPQQRMSQQSSKGRRATPSSIPSRRVPSPNVVLHVTESPRATAPLVVPSSPKHRPPTAGCDGRHIPSTSALASSPSSSKESAPTILPVGTLVTVGDWQPLATLTEKEPMTMTTPCPDKASEPQEGRTTRPASALAPSLPITTASADVRRSTSRGRVLQTKARPASALGHQSFSSFSSSLPLARGNSLITPPSKEVSHKRSSSDLPPRRPRVQSDGSRRPSHPSTPSPRIRHTLTPVPDDFALDQLDGPRSTTPLRRQSVRIASFISRFGQDAARRLTKSPTPSPLSAVTGDHPAKRPLSPISRAIRQSGTFGVTEDGSDTESNHRLYHDGHRRRRNSCGSIVEVSVRRLLYAENADSEVHSDNGSDEEDVPKDEPKPLDALDLLCLVPGSAFDSRNSATDLSFSVIDSTPSSPPGLSRSSSQWTPPSESASSLPTSPCSTYPETTESAESLLLAASQMLKAHAASLLQHADQMTEASTSLRALANESLEWGSRLMAAAGRAAEPLPFSSPSSSGVLARRLSRSPGAPDTANQRDLAPAISTPPSGNPQKPVEQLRRPSKKRGALALSPVASSSLLAEAERLAETGWNSLQVAESIRRTAPNELATAVAPSTGCALEKGAGQSPSGDGTASSSLDSHSHSDSHSSASRSGGHSKILHPRSDTLESHRSDTIPSKRSRESRESTTSDGAPGLSDSDQIQCSKPTALGPAIDLAVTAPTARDPSEARVAPVAESSWDDSTTEVLMASTTSPEPIEDTTEPVFFCIASPLPTSPTSPSSLPSPPATQPDQRATTPSFQVDDYGIVRAPPTTTVNGRQGGQSLEMARNDHCSIASTDVSRPGNSNGRGTPSLVAPKGNYAPPPSAFSAPILPKAVRVDDTLDRSRTLLSAPGRLKRRLSGRSRARDEPDRSGSVTPSGRRPWYSRWSGRSGD